MLSTPLILERLYGVPQRSRRRRFWQRLQQIQSRVGRWLSYQRWSAALAASAFALLSVVHGYYYNLLISLEYNVQAAQARIEAGQQRRNHIKRNLSQLLLFYARYEKEVMKNTTKLRSDGKTPDAADAETMGLLGRLFAVAEQYPNLQLTNTVEQFMTGVVNTESEIAHYIIGYNEAVNVYRTTKKTFPAKVFSAVLGFRDYSFYEPESRSVLEFKELKL